MIYIKNNSINPYVKHGGLYLYKNKTIKKSLLY